MRNLNGLTKVSESFNKLSFQIKKNSPAILVGTGIVGVVATVILGCKASTKVEGILADTKEKVKVIHEAAENQELLESGAYSKQDAKKDLALVYTQTGLSLAKLYAPTIITGTLSIASILASHKILHGRYVGVAAAYSTVATSFKDYRKRVAERFGEEVENEIRHNIKSKEVEKTTTDENGNEVTTTETVKYTDKAQTSEFAKWFDELSPYHQGDAGYNLTFLKQQQRYANDLLQSKEIVLLNDVYDLLGIPRTRAGAVVGWLKEVQYDENGKQITDGFIDFGLDRDDPLVRDFVNGYEQNVLLDFNVDGIVYEMFGDGNNGTEKYFVKKAR